MKAFKVFLSLSVGMLLFFFVFLGSTPHISDSSQMTMHERELATSSNCQVRCVTSTMAITATNLREQKEDDDAEPRIPVVLESQSIAFDDISNQKTSDSTDARILRPPDIIVLNCIYRI